MRSTVQGSKGKLTVPAPTKSWSPSNSCITDPTPAKPRALTAPPPLPGFACEVTSTARVFASATGN